MKTWNLRTLDDLENTVVLTFQIRPLKRRLPKHPKSSRVKSAFEVAVVATALSASIWLQTPRVSKTSIRIEADGTSIAQSIPRSLPPLSALFANQFSAGWSREQEELALRHMSTTFVPGGPELDEEELIDVLLANQHESLSEDSARLSADEVRRIVKRRRS